MSRTNSSSAGGWSREQPASSGSKRVRALSSGGGIGGGVGGVMKREISTKRAFGIVNQQDRSFSQRDCEGVHGQMTMDNRSQIQTQVLTFGASWNNRNDMNFLNRAVPLAEEKATTTCNRNGNKRNVTSTRNGTAKKRRFSDPPRYPLSSSAGTGDNTSSGFPYKRPLTGNAAAVAGGGMMMSRTALLSSQGQNRRQGGGRGGKGEEELRTEDGTCRRRGGAELTQEVLFMPGMELSGSPAPSVESEFWDGDENDHVENDQVDPREAVQEALDRLMNLEGSLTKSRGLKGDTKLLESVLFPKSTIPPIDGPQGSTLDGTRDRTAGKQSAGETSNSTRRKSSSAGGRQHRRSSSSTPITPANTSSLPQASSASASKSMSRTGDNHFSPPPTSNGSKMEDDSPHWSQKSTTSASSYSSTPQGGEQFTVSPGSGSIASAALDPTLWKLVERGDVCPFGDCAFTVDALAFGVNGDAGGDDGGSVVEDGSEGGAGVVAGGRGSSSSAGGVDGRQEKKKANRSRCRHFHTLCGCRHTRGALKGLLFQTNQLDKARNHQRKHAAEGSLRGHRIPEAQEQPSEDTAASQQEHRDMQLSQDSQASSMDPMGVGPDGQMVSQSQDDNEDDNDGQGDLEALLGDESGGHDNAGHGGGGGSVRDKGVGVKDGRRTWTDAESDRLREVMEQPGAGESRKNWAWVAARVGEAGGGRKTPSQCKMRWERILNPGVKKGLWTKEEDQKLKEVAAAMDYKWSTVAKMMGGRTYKQCRERFTNYLRDGLNCGPWSKEEDALLLEMHYKIGNKWAEIARHLKDRSENMIKNEYMKLSRDAGHKGRRRGSGSGARGDSDVDGDDETVYVRKKRGRPKGSGANSSNNHASKSSSNSRASGHVRDLSRDSDSSMPTPPDLSGSAPGFAPPGRLFAGGPVHDHDVSSRTGMPGGASANANGAAAAAAAGWAQAAHSAPVRDGTRSI